MKLNKAKKQDVLSNNNDESMNFDIGDVSVIIEILRNRLYSNPIQTLTQEYLSNGRDATREAKSNKALKVTLPTGLDSVLKIRDYGVGLSPKRVKEVFVLYGASTKRTDNNQTGGFGIGAKSAWAYTDSFTVVSYFKGVMYTYIAHTGQNANGIFEKMGEEPTTEPNGVEIQIPVKQEHRAAFINAVYRSTLFWEKKPELSGITDAEIPEDYKNFFTKVIHSDNNWKILKNTEFYKQILGFGYGTHQQIVLSVDGIPYPLNKFYGEPEFRKLLESFDHNNFMILDVSNGDVEVSATREAISDKEISKRNVINKIVEVKDNLQSFITKKIEEPQESLSDYIKNYNSIAYGFSRALWPKFMYKTGEIEFKVNQFRTLEIPQNLRFSAVKYNLRQVRGGKVNLVSDEAMIDLNRNHLFFVVRDNDDSMNKTKERIRTFIDARSSELNGSRDLIVYLIQDYAPENLDFLIKEFDAKKLSSLTYEAVKKENKKRSQDKINVRFISYEGDRSYSREYVVRTQENATFDELNANNSKYIIVPFSSEETYSKDNRQFLNWIRFMKVHGGFNVIKLSNRDYRLAKDNLDTVLEYGEVIKDVSKHIALSKETSDKVVARQKFQSNLNALSSVSANIKDEEFKDFVVNTSLSAAHQAPDPDIDTFILEQYKVYVDARLAYDTRLKSEQVFYTKYPILKQMDFRGMTLPVVTQLVDFINFVHDQRSDTNTKKRAKKS